MGVYVVRVRRRDGPFPIQRTKLPVIGHQAIAEQTAPPRLCSLPPASRSVLSPETKQDGRSSDEPKSRSGAVPARSAAWILCRLAYAGEHDVAIRRQRGSSIPISRRRFPFALWRGQLLGKAIEALKLAVNVNTVFLQRLSADIELHLRRHLRRAAYKGGSTTARTATPIRVGR